MRTRAPVDSSLAGSPELYPDRLLLVATPIAAMAAVALGLRLGAGGAVRAAIVFGAPASRAGTGLAWQVVTFDEDRGVREPAPLPMVEVTARAGSSHARWEGPTNVDGTAEMLLELPSVSKLSLEVREDGTLLAGGEASLPAAPPRAAPATAWAPFARRTGAIALDIAVLGQRVASGFPASIWVRASDAATHSPLAGVTIEPESDTSLTTATPRAVTDSRGWAHIVATPLGYGVALVVHARASDGRLGDWAGALFASPGAAEITARDRYAPGEEPSLQVVMPSLRTIAYVEIDDANGRAWATAVGLTASDGGMPRAGLRAPKLAPGLYWAVASSDPTAGSKLGPGTIVRPFFVAASDEAALAFGLDPECLPPRDSRETARVLEVCLALAGATAVPRWTVLDGFAAEHVRDNDRRARGLAVALGAIAIAAVLETALLLRVVHRARARLRQATLGADDALGDQGFQRVASVAVALLVALLGFALIAGFLVRAA